MKKDRIDAIQFLAELRQHPMADPMVPAHYPNSAEYWATAIIARFGGMHVGETGRGQAMACSDVEFLTEPYEDADDWVAEWVPKLGPLSTFADAQNNHLALFVDGAGRVHAYAVPNGALYLVGDSLDAALECLLLGRRYGDAIDP